MKYRKFNYTKKVLKSLLFLGRITLPVGRSRVGIFKTSLQMQATYGEPFENLKEMHKSLMLSFNSFQTTFSLAESMLTLN